VALCLPARVGEPGPRTPRFAQSSRRCSRRRSTRCVASLAAWQPATSDFLHLPAVLATLDRVALPAAKVVAYPLERATALAGTTNLRFGRACVGAAVVRLWPYAIDAATDLVACGRFHTRTNELFSRPDQWADTYAVAHWVPQFMWMGLWLERGRPMMETLA